MNIDLMTGTRQTNRIGFGNDAEIAWSTSPHVAAGRCAAPLVG